MLKGLVSYLIRTKIWKWLLIKIIPYIRAPYYTSIRGNAYYNGYRYLKAGDILLSIDKKKLTTLLVPGEFTHASFCVGVRPVEDFEIIEADHLGVIKSDFFDICKEADRVVILRCKDWPDDYISQVIINAKQLIGLEYDYKFDLESKNPYCAEVIYKSDWLKLAKIKTVEFLKEKYVSPDSYYYGENIERIWDSDNEKSNQ